MWEAKARSTHYYDDDGNHIEWLRDNWDVDTGEWVLRFKLNFSYDANGNLIAFIFSRWIIELNDWEKSKTTYLYNDENVLTESFGYKWNPSNSIWDLNVKLEYFYDNNGNYILRQSYSWNESTNEWVYSGKSVKSYNEDNHLVEDLVYNSDDVPFYKDLYTYNENGINSGYSSLEWDFEINEWVGDVKVDYFVSSMIVGINEIESSVFKLYPNPTNGNFNLVFEEATGDFIVELFNVNGQKLYSKQFKASTTFHTINLPEIPDGIYFVKIHGEGFVKTEKLVVR
jgi:hypothetical protein